MARFYWLGPASSISHCGICHEPIKNIFIYGLTQRSKTWMVCCPYCHARLGKGLGFDVGQEYHKEADGRFSQVL